MPALFERQKHVMPNQSVAPGLMGTFPPIPGLQGAQGGPADESTIMEGERMLQYILSALGGTASGVGMFAGGPTPLGALGAAGVGTGAVGMNNASTPNIRDVWLDQLRMAGQRRGR